jgi:hypothetical protein
MTAPKGMRQIIPAPPPRGHEVQMRSLRQALGSRVFGKLLGDSSYFDTTYAYREVAPLYWGYPIDDEHEVAGAL